MKYQKTLLAATLALAATGAMAAPDNFSGGNFTMYDPTGGINGAFNDITGFVDPVAMTWNVASVTPFFGLPWSASGGTLFGEGTHTVNVNGDGATAGQGTGNVTFTVGAGQVGGNINFAWGATTGIDVFNVWNITPGSVAGTYNWVSTDIDVNGIPGLGMIDGPFPNFSANFNFTSTVAAAPVPEASTTAMLLAGLALLGGVAARRRQKV
jgi:hypothetical protein